MTNNELFYKLDKDITSTVTKVERLLNKLDKLRLEKKEFLEASDRFISKGIGTLEDFLKCESLSGVDFFDPDPDEFMAPDPNEYEPEQYDADQCDQCMGVEQT